jgi:hypothetical protein
MMRIAAYASVLTVVCIAMAAAQVENPPSPEPKGLPEAPSWLKDPANPNRPKPAEVVDPTAAAPQEAEASPAVVANSAASPPDRFADAMKPQTHKLRPGKFAMAATGANDGDVLLLAPGVYKECAAIRASNITIKAERPGTAVFDGVACDGKGILVLKGNRTVIDGLVFRNATVRDRNGAGIRGEGAGLTVKRSIFTNNENGILYGVNAPSNVLIEDSVFDGNGTCEGSGGCSHGIYINQVSQLTVRRSTFINTHIGHHIKSRAKSTLVENCVIDDHKGNSSYLIDISNGGALVVRGNLLIKGPRTDNSTAFISFGMEGMKHPSPPPLIEQNRFINRLPSATHLLVHRPGAPKAIFKGNKQSGKIVGAIIIYRG